MALTPEGEKFPVWLRVRRRAEYQRVFQGGRKCVRPFLVVHAAERARDAEVGSPQPTRLGLTVSRRAAGKAVDRNRVKRRLRESFRRMHAELAPGYDIVVNARSGTARASYAQLAAELRKCLEQLRIVAPPASSSPSRGESGAP